SGGGLGDHFDLGHRGKGRLQPLADQGVVVGDQDPEGHASPSGRLAWTRPPVGVGPTWRVPPTSATRSFIDCNPVPGRQPSPLAVLVVPSSWTARQRSPSIATVMDTWSA